MPPTQLPTDGYFGLGGAATGAEAAKALLGMAPDDLAHCRYADAYKHFQLANLAAEASLASAATGFLGDVLLAALGGEDSAGEAGPADPPTTLIGQENGPSIVVPDGATGPTATPNGKGVVYTGGNGTRPES